MRMFTFCGVPGSPTKHAPPLSAKKQLSKCHLFIYQPKSIFRPTSVYWTLWLALWRVYGKERRVYKEIVQHFYAHPFSS